MCAQVWDWRFIAFCTTPSLSRVTKPNCRGQTCLSSSSRSEWVASQVRSCSCSVCRAPVHPWCPSRSMWRRLALPPCDHGRHRRGCRAARGRPQSRDVHSGATLSRKRTLGRILRRVTLFVIFRLYRVGGMRRGAMSHTVREKHKLLARVRRVARLSRRAPGAFDK